MSTGRTLVAGGSTGPDSSVQAITQTAHGLVVGMPIHMNGEMWQPADADDDDKSADALVDTVIDANNFVARFAGPLTLTTAQWDARTGLSGGLEIGDYYWLSPVAGAIVLDQPTSNLMQTLGVAVSATVLQVRIGEAFSAGVEGSGSGFDADMVDGYHAAEFALKAVAETITGAWEFTNQVNFGGNSNVNTDGDFRACKGSDTTKGTVYFGTGTAQYLYFNGSYFELAGGTGSILINGALAWTSANDGAGGGLDADLLDGAQGAAYAQKAVAETISGAWDFTNQVNFGGNSNVNTDGDFRACKGSDTTKGTVYFGSSTDYWLHYNGATFMLGGAGLLINGSTAWHAGNDGAASGLDADLLDGAQGIDYGRKNLNEQVTGVWNFTTAVGINALTPAGKLNVAGGSGTTNSGRPTYPGTIVITEYNATLNAAAGLEFHTRGDGGGYGYRISSLANYADLVFEGRFDSATWSERFKFGHDGRLSGKALHNNTNLPTGLTDQYIASGTWAPILSGHNNVVVGTATAGVGCWMRVGNVVTLSGCITVTPITTGQCNVALSTPIPTNFYNYHQMSGAGCDLSLLGEPAAVHNLPGVSNQFYVAWKANSLVAREINFSGTYLLLA